MKYPDDKTATVRDYEKYYSQMFYSEIVGTLADLEELYKTASYNSKRVLELKIQALKNLLEAYQTI